MRPTLTDIGNRLAAMRDGLLRELADAYVGAVVRGASPDLPDPLTGIVIGAAWDGDRATLHVDADGTTYTLSDPIEVL